MSLPSVSVVIASWNTAAYLPQTLASALAQTWPNLEVILVDDGSTDDTPTAVTPFLPRIRYERRTHLGLAAARNEGIRLASGDYIALLDADDLWHPEKIAIQIAIAGRNATSGLIACDAQEFHDSEVLQERVLPGSLFGAPSVGIPAFAAGEVTGDFQRQVIERNPIVCPAQVLLPRRIVESIGPFVDSSAQDYDYYLRVSRDYPITFHREVLTRWRFRPDSMSGPRAERPIRWGLYCLPVLVDHRSRCRVEDRKFLERRIRTAVSSLGRHLMTYGRKNRHFPAEAHLLKLLEAHPWSPALLVYLLALWTPQWIYRVCARVYHRQWTAPN